MLIEKKVVTALWIESSWWISRCWSTGRINEIWKSFFRRLQSNNEFVHIKGNVLSIGNKLSRAFSTGVFQCQERYCSSGLSHLVWDQSFPYKFWLVCVLTCVHVLSCLQCFLNENINIASAAKTSGDRHFFFFNLYQVTRLPGFLVHL